MLPQALLDSCHKPVHIRGVVKGPKRKVSRGEDDDIVEMKFLMKVKVESEGESEGGLMNPVNKGVVGRRGLGDFSRCTWSQLNFTMLMLSSRLILFRPIYRFRMGFKRLQVSHSLSGDEKISRFRTSTGSIISFFVLESPDLEGNVNPWPRI